VRIADLDLSVPDLPIRLRKTHHFRRAKGFLAKLDGLGSVLNDQIGCGRVISLGNRLGISHDFSPPSFLQVVKALGGKANLSRLRKAQ
jgi:hypothetical protein